MAKEVLKENDEQELDDVELIVEEDEKGENIRDDSNDDADRGKAKRDKEDQEGDREDKRATAEEEQDDEDGPEGESEEDLKERRRRERAARKERRDKAVARDRIEMNFLRQRNEELEKRMMAQELRSERQDHYTVEQKIAEAEEEARLAEQVIAKAIAEANGDDAARAIKYRDEALEKIRQLHGYRDKLSKEEKQTKEKPKVDPLVVSFAQDWMSKNDWYDSTGKDLDSRIVLAIDQSLVDEGFVPKTAQYWKELDRRVRAKLPHRYHDKRSQLENDDSSDDYDDDADTYRSANARRASEEDRSSQHGRAARKGPALGNSSESSSGTAKKKEIYISKDRKEALIQAGVWDDPVLRMRYVKRYQQWDKDNSSR